MTTCPSCSTPVPREAIFCPVCDAALARAAYAFYTSQGGQKVFKGKLLKE